MKFNSAFCVAAVILAALSSAAFADTTIPVSPTGQTPPATAPAAPAQGAPASPPGADNSQPAAPAPSGAITVTPANPADATTPGAGATPPAPSAAPTTPSAAPAAAPAPAEDPELAKRDQRAVYLLGLMDQQRYAEAAQGVQQLFIDFPDDSGSYELRALLEMHVGAFHAALRDFRFAASIADGSDPIPAYALGLCSIAVHDYDGAESHLADATALASPAELPDVNFANAILDAARGDYQDAIPIAQSCNKPAATELLALITYRRNQAEGMAQLEAFLNAARQNGLPRVTEEAGLRLLGPSAHDGQVTIEPALTDPELQALFEAGLSYQNAPLSTQESDVVMGSISIHPVIDATVPAKPGTVVTASVDGVVLGAVNAPPYEFEWDTRKAQNGEHIVKFDFADDSGNALSSQSRRYKVANAGSSLAHPTLPFSQPIIDQIWAKLSIHPAYKTAEYTLAHAYFERKDRNEGVAHLLITAALDSDYYHVGDLVPRIFLGNPTEIMELASNKMPTVTEKPSSGPIEFWRGNPNIKEVALTFDDGPNPVQTPKLLDALHDAGAVGTFFVVGIRASADTAVIRRMVAEGHEVENHTYTHPNLDQAISAHIREEYLRNAVVIDTLTGRWPRFLRPPGGNSNPEVMKTAMECGMVGGFWTLDALNAEDTGSGQVVSDYVVTKTHNGSIVLMHNGTQATIDAIPTMVAGLRARGFRIVTLAQLARDAGIDVH